MVSAESQQAMDAAKHALAEFMRRNGHNDTTVHERVLPVVTHHTITKTEHEEVEVAVDREQHIEHYHHTIQPITDSETLDVQHRAHVLPIETKIFEHDDREEVHRRVAAEAAKFRDETVIEDGEHTHTSLPTLESAHVHHHVREVIQPILNKHTIEPWIVHTAHQIHEVHHLAARHHQLTSLPAVTLAEFKKQGGILTGREERYDFFQGEPKSSSGVLGDSEKNPLPTELRETGHHDRVVYDTQHQHAQGQDNTQQAPAVPSIAHAPTIQGNVQRTPTSQGNLTRTPTGPGNLARQPTAPSAAPQQAQPQQPQTSQPHPHTDPTAHDLHPASAGSQAPPSQSLHPSQYQPGTPSTGHFGLMPLQLARDASGRPAIGMRSASRTPQPTTALSAPGLPQSSAAQQVGAQTQRQGSSPSAGQSQQQQQQQGQTGQQPKGQQQNQQQQSGR